MSKVKLKEFISEYKELDDLGSSRILKSIKYGQDAGMYKAEFIFNRHSFKIDFAEREATIYDDVFAEHEPLTLSLEKFIEVISKSSEVENKS